MKIILARNIAPAWVAQAPDAISVSYAAGRSRIYRQRFEPDISIAAAVYAIRTVKLFASLSALL